MPLGANRWGKSGVRVSKVLRGQGGDDFIDVTVRVLLQGDVEAAHTEGDNASVLPTDTMRNTIYGLAQEHLGRDLEGFGEVLCRRFLSQRDIHRAEVTMWQSMWERGSPTGFLGGRSEQRLARVVRGSEEATFGGVEGLVVLKTTGSAFEGFPKDEFTTLPEAADRILATSVSAEWAYERMPADTFITWALARTTLVDRFFEEPSSSAQHQGYLMAEAVLVAVPEIGEITLRLPNQHHLPFDLTRFGLPWNNTVFHPVSEPYGDIALTVTR